MCVGAGIFKLRQTESYLNPDVLLDTKCSTSRPTKLAYADAILFISLFLICISDKNQKNLLL